MTRVVVVGVLLALVSPAAASTGGGRLTVFAASSLTDVFPKIDGRSRYNFAGSDELAFQIRQGAPADVFAAASPKEPKALYLEGLVAKPVAFATNKLVLVVPRGNPARIRTVRDVARQGVKLVVAAEGVPIGDYTRKVLARLGLSRALRNVVSEEQDVRGVLAKIALGEADAGFVYATDALAAKGRVRAIAIPARGQPTVRYEIAVIRTSRRLDGARAFVRRLLGASGRAVLKRAGFELP